jgi:hypothetical protein
MQAFAGWFQVKTREREEIIFTLIIILTDLAAERPKPRQFRFDASEICHAT